MDIRQQVVEAFQAEHREQVDGIRAITSELADGAPTADDPRVNEAFRMAHTLKGGARVCAYQPVEALGHRMESLFAGLREGKLAYTRAVGDAILAALDMIEDWMAACAAGTALPAVDAAIQSIEVLLNSPEKNTTANTAPPIRAEVRQAVAAAPAPPEAELESDPTPTVTPREIETLRVHAGQLDEVVRAADALCGSANDQDLLTAELRNLSYQVSRMHEEFEAMRSIAGSMLRESVENPAVARVARAAETVSQRTRQIVRQMRSVNGFQRKAAWTLRSGSDDLRRVVQQARLVSAENVLQGLGPMVRSLARDEGKSIEFRAGGLDVRADRVVLQSLKDPIVHALRNAVVHGIESPAERVASGKSETGQITLTLQTQGNRLLVRIEDDGRGIRLAEIAREAERHGFAKIGDNPEQQREQLMRTLFRPGFSTVSQVNELAGRGMGLSIVHETARRLRGSVQFQESSGPGAALVMRVPLFVSAERLLLVSTAEQLFALPMHAIDRAIRIETSEVQTIDGREMVIIDDRPILLARIAPASSSCAFLTVLPTENRSLLIALMKSGDRTLGLVVDRFIAEREALIRELDQPACDIPYIGGAILLEDNGIALVIETDGLIDLATHAQAMNVPTTPTKTRKAPTVLVVDDSFTTRTLEKGILETNGYDVRVAVDGVEALNTLRSEPIDAVIADVQMPHMDGLTLLSAVRADSHFESLPFILVTSLESPEDRRRGLDLGANAYIVKQQFDHQLLLDTIQQFV